MSDKLSRRRFIALAAGAAAGSVLLEGCSGERDGGLGATTRRARLVYEVRHEAALRHLRAGRSEHARNGDEARYTNHIASFSKALPHSDIGEVNHDAYAALVAAIESRDPQRFERVPLGGKAPLANPAAAFAYELEGPDSQELAMPAPPAFADKAAAVDMAEVYWRAYTRDVPYALFAENPLAQRAASDMASLSGTEVTADTVFRGVHPGDKVGPPVSQFLLKDVPMGAMRMSQRFPQPLPGKDFLVTHEDCVNAQSGRAPAEKITLEPVSRYMHTPRAVAEYVRKDFPYEAFLSAAAIILDWGPMVFDPSNPYRSMKHQSAFITMGPPQVFDDIARVTGIALKASWYQKWVVHRRLRPEAYAMRTHCTLTGIARYPVHASLLDSDAVAAIHSTTGSYALPMAYPDGAPTHPSYPAGHAAIAGACATILKAHFDESLPVSQPVVPAADGTSLQPHDGELTVGGEIEKLASNITHARDTAGVHYRTDGIQGMLLGEQVAISVLKERKLLCPERYDGLTLHRFDGTAVTV